MRGPNRLSRALTNPTLVNRVSSISLIGSSDASWRFGLIKITHFIYEVRSFSLRPQTAISVIIMKAARAPKFIL